MGIQDRSGIFIAAELVDEEILRGILVDFSFLFFGKEI